MDMQGKQPFSIHWGEDPSLPWPDCDGSDMPSKPGSDAAGTPETPETPAPDVTPDDGMHMPDNGMGGDNGTQMPNDSIDPRLLSLAMGFVPYQAWETPYEFDVALKRGTIFPSLDKPFLGEEALPR